MFIIIFTIASAFEQFFLKYWRRSVELMIFCIVVFAELWTVTWITMNSQ